MSFMDTNSGPSSSYSSRGGRDWGGGGGRGYSRGGRGYNSQGRGSFGGYDQDRSGRGHQNGANGWGDPRGSSSRGGFRGGSGAPNGWGNQGRGGRYQGGRGRGREGPSFEDPEDLIFGKVLRGHEDGITALVVNDAAGQLFSGSKDKTVRMWDIRKGQLLRTVEVGGEVDSMLLESGMLFVGMHASGSKADLKTLPGSIRVYNLTDGSEHALQGHLGPVYALAAGKNMLFSGGHDQSIRVWQFNQTTGVLEAAAVLTAAQGGHSVEVKAFQVIDKYLFSGDFHGVIKVWDMDAGQCVQSIQPAHDGVIMSLLAWQGYLLSGSVDGAIRIWQFLENPGPGAVVEASPSYSHPPPTGNSPARPNGTAPFGKVLTLSGTTDKGGSSVLLSGYSGNRNVRLWGLPDFSDRGCLNAIEAIAVACSHDHIFAGDYTRGSIKMWRWKTA